MMVQPKGVLKKEARIVQDEHIQSVKRTSTCFTNGWVSRGEVYDCKARLLDKRDAAAG